MSAGWYTRKTKDVPFLRVPKAPPFHRLILDLSARGYPKAQIARACNMTREKLYSLLSEKYDPTYVEGLMIIELHVTLTKKEENGKSNCSTCGRQQGGGSDGSAWDVRFQGGESCGNRAGSGGSADRTTDLPAPSVPSCY